MLTEMAGGAAVSSAALPGTAFLLLQAPQRGDWFVYPRRRGADEDEAAFTEAVVLPSVRSAMAMVD